MRSFRSLSAVFPVFALLVVGLGASCEPSPIVKEPSSAAALRAGPPPKGVDEAAMDPSADPCADFYQYACGGWSKSTPIPADRSSWDRSFSEIDERNLTTLRAILDGKGLPLDAYAEKVKDFYKACMDEEAAEKIGLKHFDPVFEAISKVTDKASLVTSIRALLGMGFDLLFDFSSAQDFADATSVIGAIEQGGLGLPDRDDYLREGAKDAEVRKGYEQHIAKMLELSGVAPADAKAQAAAVLALETELARASMTRLDQREPKNINHKMNGAELKKLAPSFDWDAYLTLMNVKLDASINVAEPKFLEALEARLGKTSSETWRAYLRWHVMHQSAPMLSRAFVDEDFRFRSTYLTGAKENLPRWKRCVSATDAAMGEALAQPFVKGGFGEEGRERAKSMVVAIESAMERNLRAIAWMDEPTRLRAFEKLHKVNNKIGYPDKWRAYDALTIDRGSYLRNALHATLFERARKLAKIGRPVDRHEWLMTPPTANAYYEGSLNEMVFPAGVLQPPFFDRTASIGVNFGAIGMVMGHELTHGFDDEGRQFDGDGNLRDWWSPSVSKEFDARAACLAKQFDGYVVLSAAELAAMTSAKSSADAAAKPEGDLHVDGKLTLGENIADLGGIKLAYAAFKEATKGKPTAKIGEFDDEQQFFLGYAQSWCTNTRAEAKRVNVTTDPHAPPQFRVNGPLSDLPQFANAFHCRAGTAMVRADRCEVW